MTHRMAVNSPRGQSRLSRYGEHRSLPACWFHHRHHPSPPLGKVRASNETEEHYWVELYLDGEKVDMMLSKPRKTLVFEGFKKWGCPSTHPQPPPACPACPVATVPPSHLHSLTTQDKMSQSPNLPIA